MHHITRSHVKAITVSSYILVLLYTFIQSLCNALSKVKLILSIWMVKSCFAVVSMRANQSTEQTILNHVTTTSTEECWQFNWADDISIMWQQQSTTCEIHLQCNRNTPRTLTSTEVPTTAKRWSSECLWLAGIKLDFWWLWSTSSNVKMVTFVCFGIV